ncbi:MAG: hypothetical protein ACOZNI_06090 [Myxococcota bacterium]
MVRPSEVLGAVVGHARPDMPVVFLRGTDGDAFESLVRKTVAAPYAATPEEAERLSAMGYVR